MKNQQKIVTGRFSHGPDRYADEYARETSVGYSFRVRKERLLELLEKGSGKLLDVGCGPGVMTKEIRDLGFRYHGCDISSEMIEEARRRAPEAKFSVENVSQIDAPDNSYDSIVAMGLVEYLDNQTEAIREMRRVLKPGGKIFISVPNWWSPPRMWDRWFITPLSFIARPLSGKHYDSVTHHEYSSHSYKKLLEKEGFRTEKIVYYNFRLLPRPLDYWFPKTAVFTAKLIEPLRNTPFRFWGTGMIVEAEKLL